MQPTSSITPPPVRFGKVDKEKVQAGTFVHRPATSATIEDAPQVIKDARERVRQGWLAEHNQPEKVYKFLQPIQPDRQDSNNFACWGRFTGKGRYYGPEVKVFERDATGEFKLKSPNDLVGLGSEQGRFFTDGNIVTGEDRGDTFVLSEKPTE